MSFFLCFESGVRWDMERVIIFMCSCVQAWRGYPGSVYAFYSDAFKHYFAFVVHLHETP